VQAAPQAVPRKRRPAKAGATPVVRDAEATRQRILDAAEAEFSAKGLAGARVDVIARGSGANKRMIYYYFGNKENLYVAVLENAYTHMRREESGLSLDSLDPLAAIRALVLFKFDYYERHPVLISLLNGENVHGARYLRRSRNITKLYMPLVASLSDIIKSGAKKGVVRGGIDPVELYVSIAALSYFYFSNRATLSNAFGRAFDSAAARRARRAHVVEVILGYVRP
jgi:AcrR family transcriptional regulator